MTTWGIREFVSLVAVVLVSVQAALADTASVEAINTEVDRMRQEAGQAPDDAQYLEIVRRFAPSLTMEEYRESWRYWRASLRPSISTADLAELIEAKRQAVYDAHFRYTVEHQSLVPGGSPISDQSEQREFMLCGNKLLFKAVPAQPSSGQARVRTMAYDAKVIRTYATPALEHEGFVTAPGSLAPFWDLRSPLVSGMLVDSPRVFGKDMPACDLVSLLRHESAAVLEGPENGTGAEAVVVILGMPPLFKAYLDAKKNYALLRMETYKPVRQGGDIATSSVKSSLWKCEELEDGGEGIWLPRKVVMEYYVTRAGGEAPIGSPTLRVVTTVEEMQVNQGVDERVFTDIFPLETPVLDKIVNVSFVAGGTLSIEQVLDISIDKALGVEPAASEPAGDASDAETAEKSDEGHVTLPAVAGAVLCIMVFLIIMAVRRKRRSM